MQKIVKLPVGQRPNSKSADLIATPTAAQILSALDVCQRKGWMGSVLGAPGIGKTKTFTHYAADRPINWYERRRARIPFSFDMPPALREKMQEDAEFLPYTPGVLMVTMTAATRAPVRMLNALIRGLTADNQRMDFALSTLRERLRKGDLIIVDEAQHLQDDALDVLRSLNDDPGVGVVIGGNPTVISRGGKAREADMAQFFSRIAVRLHFDATTDEDFRAFFDHHKVVGARSRALLRSLAGPAHLGPLRRIGHFIDLCHELAGEGRPIELDHAEKAIAALADR